jgi:hypothetical protein
VSARRHTTTTVFRALAALIGVVVAFGAAAYGATRHAPAVPGSALRRAASHLRRPVITVHPDPVAVSTSARFAFTDRQPNLRFECRLDSGGWRACRAPVDFTGLAPGSHTFSTRAVDRRGRRSRATRFRWQLLEPKRFSIVPRLSGIGPLYPGAPPVALPLTVVNPNPAPIFLTGLRVTVDADPGGCASAENLILDAAGISVSSPLEVPAGGSVSLPAPGLSAPAIQLRDLPVDQDACEDASFPLDFSGSARG